MNMDLNRFIEAQERAYDQAFSEIESGKKKGHWMWYIFPQFKGLGYSETSKYYAIQNLEEAIEFLNHPILGARLRQITSELLRHKDYDAYKIFGSPDYLKLKSCMTLFSQIDNSNDKTFAKVLENYFNGEVDQKTINLLGSK